MAQAKTKTAGKKAPAKAPAKKTAAQAPAKKSTGASYAFKARAVTEITATFKDVVGLTAKVAAAVAKENVNILAGQGFSANVVYRKAVFSLIVDDFAKAAKALDKIGADDIEELSVILVDMQNKVGALERAAKIISDAGINIHYFYATTSNSDIATCVFKTANDKKAIALLNKQ